MKSARYGALACALTISAVVAVPASAAKLPNGSYNCTLSLSTGTQQFGKVKIKGTKYTPKGQKSGKFKVSGTTLKFKSGPWKKLFSQGTLQPLNSGGVQLALTSKEGGNTFTYCEK